MNCYKAFVSGNMVHSSMMSSNGEQIHPNDVEEKDVTRQMVMVVFRAKKNCEENREEQSEKV